MNDTPHNESNEYRVTPADIQNLLGGEGGVDLRTVTQGGKTIMRIIGVQPGTTAARLGARNDDTIESINGVAAGGPGAMRAWTQMAMTEKRLVLRGTRDGQPRTTVLLIEGR